MNQDPIKHLIKRSGLSAPAHFSDLVLEGLDRRIQKRARIKGYILMASVVVFTAVLAAFLNHLEFKVRAFDVIVVLPKVITILGLNALCCFVILHLSVLLQLGNLRNRVYYDNS